MRGDLGVLLLLGLVVCATGLGLRDPWAPDEPRFALIGRDMALGDDWLFPRRAGELYPDKPPLYLWTVATVYRLTGSLRLANQLPSLLAGLSTLLLVYDLGRRLWNRRVGMWAGLALLATVQFPLQVRSGQIDASVTLWITLGLYGLCRHLLLGPAWGWYAAGAVACGLGVVTKGVGFLPLLVLLPFAVGRRSGFRQLRVSGGGWRWLLAIPALLLPILLWLVPMVLRAQGHADLESYRDNILWNQTANRYADPWGHLRPWWYFAEVIATLWLPLVLLAPWLLPGWWRRLRRRDGRYLLLLGWALLVVLFFSASAAKRGVYILPALPAVALAAAPLLPGLLRRPRVRRFAWLALLTLATLLVLAAAFAAGGGVHGEHHDTAERLWPTVAATAAAGFLLAVLGGRRRGVQALAGFLLVFWTTYGLAAYPIVDPARSSRPFFAEIEDRLPAGSELAVVGWKEQFFLAAHRPMTHFGYLTPPVQQLAYAARWLARPPARGSSQRWLLVPNGWIGGCIDPLETVDLGLRHRLHWELAPAGALLDDCPHPQARPDAPPEEGFVGNRRFARRTAGRD